MDRRQQLGLAVLGAWTAFVIVLTIVTHRLAAMGLLGLAAAFALPFRKRSR